jgi:DNA-binding transcriptional MerR regulator
MAPGTLDAYQDSIWNLTEFVDAANALLPGYLPKEASGRLADDVNPRLVRHYATIGLLPEPGKEGREARYLFEHLVHLLVVRKLLAEGFGSSAIRDAVAGRSADDLVSLLEGSVRVVLVPEGGEKPPHASSFPPSPQVAPPSSSAARARAALLRNVRAKAGLSVEEIAPMHVERAMRAAPDDARVDEVRAAEARAADGRTDRVRADDARLDEVHELAASSPAAEPSPVARGPIDSGDTRWRSKSDEATQGEAAGASFDAEDVTGTHFDAAAAHLDTDEDRFHTSLASIFRRSEWSRIRIDEGLELHVRDDYRLPRNRAGDEDLLRLLKAALLDLEQRSKGKP